MGDEDRLNEALTDQTDQTGQTGPTAKSDRPIKTYYLGPELCSRLERLQAEWGIENESALARWLLGLGLEAVAGGARPEQETVTRFKLE